ncbi:MAG: TraB/GumN family protein [Gammaproteobacteria bacterium]|nr:MAG: TraB/GumN family protein [Gammaproteobacteria bacterium]RKZ39975.1 MAG: TraB/GumN family protein [Gammaproteobacteria bacterium]RKZ74368.1 MAG: TraB/GumN family protein [Gammaproteobacteria bacterium]
MKFHDTYWLISLFLVLLTAQNLFADESQKGLLWQIEKPGLTPSYIFGTIHSEDPRVNKLPPIVLPRFEQAKSASFEILMDMPNLLKVASAMFFTGEQSLDKLIDETLYLSVVKALRQHQMPATMVKRLKPWAVVMTLSSPPMKTGEFLDLLLYQKAQRLQIPTYGLEKVEEQLAVFDDISLDDQIILLKDTLKNINEVQTVFDKLHELYLQRDLTTLLKFSIEEMKNGSDNLSLVDSFYERLVDDRNIRMVKRMEARLQEGNAFIAIGALHLPGKKGVLKLLQERGYQVLAMY